MPKLVDTPARQAAVYPAVCRIVAKEGVPAATVRRVAEEAGLSSQALRGTWPSQERLHLRVVQWLARKWREDQWTWRTDDATEYVMKVLRAMVPLNAEARDRARAWSAYAGTAGEDSTMAEVVRQHGRERVMLVGQLLESLRSARQDSASPSRIFLPEDVIPASPDTLDDEALHMLVMVQGLSGLVCDPALPLSLGRAAAWLDAWLDAWPLGGR